MQAVVAVVTTTEHQQPKQQVEQAAVVTVEITQQVSQDCKAQAAVVEQVVWLHQSLMILRAVTADQAL
jgi:hypothetical protein